MKTIVHNQIIRVAGFPRLNKVEVSTLEGYVADHNEKYGPRDNPDTVEAHLELDRKFKRETQWAWASQANGILTENYSGKMEKLAAERAAIAAAPEIEHDEIVEIEGLWFTAKIMGDYSDPVHFKLIDPK